MNGNFAKAFGIGIAAIAVVVAGILFMQRGAHMDLQGTIRAHTISTSKDDSLAFIDLRVTNPSDYSFMVREVRVTVETPNGNKTTNIISRTDALRLFDSLPHNGPYNPPLYTRAEIPANSTKDYTLAAQFNVPEEMLNSRTRFVVDVDEVNGKSFQFTGR